MVMPLWQVWLTGLGAACVLMVVTWVASLIRRDASLVDRVWGLAFVVLAWTYLLVGGVGTTRAALVVTLVTVWGLRLSAFIAWRNWGHGEDARYAAMRARRPDSFAARSLGTVFLLQAGLAWLISVPLLAAIAVSGPMLGWLDLLGVLLWLVGFVFEALGDHQLSRFLADPANRGMVMDRGLWRYTRHPNYFGDTVVWWAYLAFALSVGAWWAIAGTTLMSYLIVKVSGVALTERRMNRSPSRRVGHDEYVRRTNAFFPGPRRA
jgi:steroid 5-alpha reductase family enzyme